MICLLRGNMHPMICIFSCAAITPVSLEYDLNINIHIIIHCLFSLQTALDDHWSVFCLREFPVLHISCKWNPTICAASWLAWLPQHDSSLVFKIHTRRSMCQHFQIALSHMSVSHFSADVCLGLCDVAIHVDGWVLWYNVLSCHWEDPHRIQLPAGVPGQWQVMAHVLGFLLPTWGTWVEFWLLASAWLSPGFCRCLRNELAVDGSLTFCPSPPSLTLALQIHTYIFFLKRNSSANFLWSSVFISLEYVHIYVNIGPHRNILTFDGTSGCF